MLLIILYLLMSLFIFPGQSQEVAINDNYFNPSFIEIKAGDSVIFKNIDNQDHWPASNIHPTHTIYPEFDPKKPIKPGESWEFKFMRVGKWTFHDHLFPDHMGTITVSDSAQSKPDSHFKTIYSLINYLKTSLAPQLTIFSFVHKPIQISSKFPQHYQLDDLYSELNFKCSNTDFDCINQTLLKITSDFGPQAASDILRKLQTDQKVSSSVDDHQLAHQVGRETARVFGMDAAAFLLCPMADFNGGCQHGFFEYVLGKTSTTKEAAQSICETLKTGYSSKDYFYCYHGVGHGVMMAEAYDLENSLKLCDQLDSPAGQDGCWQGVFMENVIAGMQNTVRPGIFSDTDPLAPCDNEPRKYQHECFINHSGWLMKFYQNDIQKASRACLKAPKDFISACLQSIGLLVTNPSWQKNLVEKEDASFEGLAWDLCTQFPESYIEQCALGAVDHIMNSNQFDLTSANKFCRLIQSDLVSGCFERMGSDIKYQSASLIQAKTACQSLGKYASICLKGANL